MPVFLDSNVFLYAAGGDHPLRAPCRRILVRLADGTLEATTSTEVVQELIHVLGRRGLRHEALRLATSVLDLVPDMLPVRPEDMRRTLAIMERHPDLPARDALHVATMHGACIGTIVSADRHFDLVEEIRRTDPSTA